jgi:Phage P22-like portal protein
VGKGFTPMSEVRDTDVDAVTAEEIFTEAKDRMSMSLEADSHNREAAKDAMLFREGENHWDSDYVTSASQENPELVINLTDTLVGRVVNSIADLETRGKCHPIADGADTERADVINGLGRHVEYRSDAPVAYDNATDNAVSGGWGWWRLLGEWAAQNSFDKEIRIAPIFDCFTVYPDPGSIMPTAQDMRWCLIALMQKRTEFKRLNPGVDLVSWSDVGSTRMAADWETKEEIRVAQYFRILDKQDTLYQLKLPDGSSFGVFKSNFPTDAQLRRIQAKIVSEREGTRSEVQLFHLNGMKVTQREVLPGTFIPVIRVQGNARMIDGKVYRRGMVQTMMDPQRMVDYGETSKILRLGLATKSKYIAAEGQLNGHPEWTESNREPLPTLTYKPVTVETGQGAVLLPPPMPIPPAQVEAGFTEFVQGMRSNLLAIAGMPNEPGQDQSQGQTVSGRALQRRDKLSDQSHSQYYKNKKLAVAHTWRIMLEWFPHYYSEERMQRIIGGDGKPQMVQLNKEMTDEQGVTSVKNDLSVGRYDVVMEAGPSYETMREQGAESLLELMSSPPIAELITKTGPDLLMRSMDFEYAEELADRLAAQTPEGLQKIMENLPKEARAVVQSLSAQNQQLKQALQAAQLEVKYGMAKAHLAATVKAHDVEESNKTKRQDTETRADTAIKVEAMRGHVTLAKEEIAVGGELLNTHVEAAHNKEAAETALKSAEKAENGAA